MLALRTFPRSEPFLCGEITTLPTTAIWRKDTFQEEWKLRISRSMEMSFTMGPERTGPALVSTLTATTGFSTVMSWSSPTLQMPGSTIRDSIRKSMRSNGSAHLLLRLLLRKQQPVPRRRSRRRERRPRPKRSYRPSRYPAKPLQLLQQ